MGTRLTSKQIMDFIRQQEPELSKGVELHSSSGNWYFAGGIADRFFEQSVGVCRLSHLPLDRWLDSFRAKCEAVKQEDIWG